MDPRTEWNKASVTHECKPGENQVEGLIYELNVDPELAQEAVRRPVNVVELDSTMNSSKE